MREGSLLDMNKQPISETHPDLANEAVGWDPTKISYGSKKRLKWKCDKGHIYEQTPNNRTAQGFGCSYCSGKRVLTGFNDLKTTHSMLANEAHGWDPTVISFGSHKNLDWKCSKGHVWNAKVLNRAINKSGCPVCDGKRIEQGFNDLLTTHPKLAAEANGWDPAQESFGSGKKKTWKCMLGHEWIATIGSRSDGRGCPVCSGRKTLPGFNDLATKFPNLAMEADGWDPTKVSPGNNRKFPWICKKGHSWSASPNQRTNLSSECPSCAVTGYDQNEKGFLYFLRHPEWLMFQIGITNYPKQRLTRHLSKGWELIEIRGPMDGLLAMQWESAILRMLSSKGADLSNKQIVGKFDGYSESWSISKFQVSSIKELMSLVEEAENFKK